MAATWWPAWALALGLGLAVAGDWWFATWPAGLGGWLALLGLLGLRWSSPAAAVALGLATALAPVAAPALPLAALSVWRREGPRRALALALVGATALALSLLAGVRASWIGGVPWQAAPTQLNAGAHDLWWLLLEHFAAQVRPTLRVAGLPVYAWTVILWLPCFALGGLALWRRAASLPTAGGYAALAFALIVAGRTPADGLAAALIALAVAERGKGWAVLTGVAVVTAVVNLALAPWSVPPAAPRAAIDARTLNALARATLLVAWSVALARPLWLELPDRWRRVFVAEPPSSPRS